MSTTILPPEIMSHSIASRSFGGESFSFRHFVDGLHRAVPCAEAVLITTLPRGGLQIGQPQKLADSLVKSYVREWHTDDEASWKAISTGKPSRAKAGTRYTDAFLKPFGFEHAAAAAVSDPVLPGYSGALQLLRTAEQGNFTAQELEKLGESAAQLGDSLRDARVTRTVIEGTVGIDSQPTDVRQFVLSEQGDVLFNKPAFDRLDENIRQQITKEASVRSRKSHGVTTTDRLMLPDSKGDQWIVNAVTYPSYPALATGPVVFFSILPSCVDWTTVRAADFQADSEMARLVPAMKFMAQEYQRGPTLTEIARTVHLSPFHFHRRFSELFGLTPKHFLLDCQINDAKGELISGEKELARIAKECGFAHQSHFTSRFKQATGLTPTRWRRMASTRRV